MQDKGKTEMLLGVSCAGPVMRHFPSHPPAPPYHHLTGGISQSSGKITRKRETSACAKHLHVFANFLPDSPSRTDGI